MSWIQNNFRRQFPASARYLVAVSGGRDSVALLHALLDLGYRKLIVCHLNHQLRGRSAAADARFVEQLAAKNNLDLVLGSTNVRALAAEKKMSIETAARAARYQFFARAAKQKRCRSILLAHHADDLVETFLLNLFRGAGMSGLAAMREVSERKIDNVDLTIVRPLLGAWRDEIDRYVRARRLKFREDASNKNLAPLRNRIRRRIIPYIEKQFGRNVRRSIWRAAMIAAEEENFFDALLPRELAGLIELPVKKLRALSIAAQRRAIRTWLRGRKIVDLSFDMIENVRALLDPNFGAAKYNLPQDRHVRRRAGKIFVE